MPGWEHPPGPVDRESFFAAQARHRGATWRLTAACTLCALLSGVALAPLLTPLLVGGLVIGADLANLVVPMPDLLPLGTLGEGGGPAPAPFGGDLGAPAAVAGALLLLALLVLPGAMALLVAWLGMRELFQRAGVDVVLDALGARPPSSGDPEERQLQNLVEEMGIAGGVPPPALRLLDVDAANAAVLARAGEAPTLVVTRGLLARLGRDPTQGIVAHLVAAAGNGDPPSAFNLLALVRAYGLVTAVLASPYGREGRRTVWRLLRWAFWPRPERAVADAREIDALLARAVSTGSGSDDRDLDRGRFPALKSFFMLPFFVAQTTFWVNQQLLGTFLLGPLLTGLWRTRRYLADADAVQLTRNPDAVADALARLADLGDATVVAGAESAAHLFVVWPPGARHLGGSHGFAASFHPPIPGRLRRLVALGAAASWQRKPLWSPPAWMSGLFGKLFALPLALLLLALWLGAGLVMVLASVALDGLFLLFLFVGPLHWLLRYGLGV